MRLLLVEITASRFVLQTLLSLCFSSQNSSRILEIKTAFSDSLYHPQLHVCYTNAMGVLDLVFPKKCVRCRKLGAYICPSCFALIAFFDSYLCLVCNRASFDGKTHPGCITRFSIDGATASIVYKGVVKKLLYQFKYQPNLTDLRSVLSELFYEGIIQQEQVHEWISYKPVFVPIPLSQVKLRKRGYNQAKLLAEDLAKRFELSCQDMLTRVKDTKTQVTYDRKGRLENIKGAFELSKQFDNRLQHIILVDDVITSGATMLEAAKVLKKAGTKCVWGIALAHGQ